MFNTGWAFRLNPDYNFSFASGPNLTDFYFYLDYDQPDGPKQLATGIDFGTGVIQPAILLYGEDANTTDWINRGTLGGSFAATNIRPQDINQDTPFHSTVAKGVRCFTGDGSSTQRYYEAASAAIADITTEDLYYEAVFCRTSTARSYLFEKRNSISAANVGYSVGTTSATSLSLGVRPVGGVIVSASTTTSAQSWQHACGIFDNDDATATGLRGYRGSESVVGATHVVGSLSNVIPLRIGARALAAYSADEDIIIAYLAIYIAPSFLPGGASNDTTVLPIIRARQAAMAGLVPQKGLGATTITEPFRYSQKSVSGKMKSFRKGAGFCVTDTNIMVDGTMKTSIDYQSSRNINAGLSPETYATWTPTNTTITNGAMDAPAQPVVATSGSSFVVSSGLQTSANISIPFSTVVNRRYSLQTFFKAGSSTHAYLAVADAGAEINRYAFFNLATGALGTLGAGSVKAFIIPYVDGWYFCSFVFPNITANPTLSYSIGFADADNAFAVTGDGVTANGFIYGSMIYALNAIITEPTPLPITIDQAVSWPVHIFDGTVVTTNPYTLWWESFASSGVSAIATALGIEYCSAGVSTTNANLLQIVQAPRAGTRGNVATVAQWSFDSLNQTGDNSPVSGKLIRFASAIDTNDIKLYNTDGTLIGSDALAAVPPGGQVFIRVGNNTAGTISGGNIVTTRVGIWKTLRTNSDGPV